MFKDGDPDAYGKCPECGAPCKMRERRKDGNDTCENGHKYPSASAIMSDSETPAVTSFDGEYRFLSNFWPAQVEFEGITYTSSEHAYQAAKTTNPSERQKIKDLPTPGKAKRAGQKVTMRPDWDAVKLKVMEDILRSKFSDPELRKKLHQITGEIQEGNTWGDTLGSVWR
jgi:hypothetical protein